MVMSYRPDRLPRLARAWGALTLLSFLATGPGPSGVEVAFHLRDQAGSDHARSVHVEAADAQAHADHCQLGLATPVGRLPHQGGIRMRATIAHVSSVSPTACFAPCAAPTSQSFPRAPPALS